MNAKGSDDARSGPPCETLRKRLQVLAASLRETGDARHADDLTRITDTWWEQAQRWNASLSESLRAYHEINNALVGVRGNAQLLLMGPLGAQPETKHRLEVMIRESTRIREIAAQLREIRARLEEGEGRERAA